MAQEALWLCDEGAGTVAADALASPVNLDLLEGPTWSSNAGGNGVTFGDDTGQRLQKTLTGTKLEHTSPLSACTVEIFATLAFAPSWASRGFFELRSAGSDATGLFIRTSHVTSSLVGAFAGAAFSVTTGPSLNTPHVFHFVFDGGLTVYIDGSPVASTDSITTEALQDLTAIQIGFTENGGGSFPGTIWAVGFASHAFDAAEAAARSTALHADHDSDPASAGPTETEGTGAATYSAWSAAGAASQQQSAAGAASYSAWSAAGAASESLVVVGAVSYNAWSSAGAVSLAQSVAGAASYSAWTSAANAALSQVVTGAAVYDAWSASGFDVEVPAVEISHGTYFRGRLRFLRRRN